VSDLRQMYLTEESGQPTYGCPDHPDWALMAIVQQTRTAPVTVTKEGDSFNVEHSPIAEFIHDMATEVTVAYCCANPECAFAISPDQLGELKEHRGSRQLGY